jgi:signal transduction histidine kinase
MRAPDDSTRILRIAAWIWIGYLMAMGVMDLALYTRLDFPVLAEFPLRPGIPDQPLPPAARPPLVPRLAPVLLYYAVNGLTACVFLSITYWDRVRERLGSLFHPLLLFVISAAPILVNVLLVPRFPPGPLANAEGMALRQVPVLFVALALVAWVYPFPLVVFFSIAITGFELGLVYLADIDRRSLPVFLFIAVIRTISFIALGVFIGSLVARLRQQRESLRRANADLAHYASTREQLAVSRERNRLARELHDTLAHSLTAISVSLETARAYFDLDPEKSRRLIETSLETTRLGAEETRRALKSLRSNALEDLGLGLAIRRAAESAAARFHLDLDFSLPQQPLPPLSPDVELAVFRIAQEAIENIARHSRATAFRVSLAGGGGVTLRIEDDGAGFDVQAGERSGHFGLMGMRERAELAGGQLKIDSEHGRGTQVVLTI